LKRALVSQADNTVRERLDAAAFDDAKADGFAWTDDAKVAMASSEHDPRRH